jgi:hypothetical protein
MDELECKTQEIQKVTSMSSSNDGSFSVLLNARLGLVVKELTEMRSENDRNASNLERSLKKCTDLRSQTAEANGRLLRCQHKHAVELARVASVLSDEQKLAISSRSSSESHCSSTLESSADMSSAASDEVVVRRAEWNSLLAELAKMRAMMGLGLEDDVVGSDQFRQLQTQLAELKDKSEKQVSD